MQMNLKNLFSEIVHLQFIVIIYGFKSVDKIEKKNQRYLQSIYVSWDIF